VKNKTANLLLLWIVRHCFFSAGSQLFNIWHLNSSHSHIEFDKYLSIKL